MCGLESEQERFAKLLTLLCNFVWCLLPVLLLAQSVSAVGPEQRITFVGPTPRFDLVLAARECASFGVFFIL